MGFRLLAVLVLLVAGCAAEPIDTVDAPMAVCPPEHQGLAIAVADKIERRAQRQGGYGVSQATGRRVATLNLFVNVPSIFEAARWADLHPACFTDEARVTVYALTDYINVSGHLALQLDEAELAALLAALRAS